MAPRMDDIMRLCCDISAHQNIEVMSAKGAMMVGGCAFLGMLLGGLLGGPLGIAGGGAVGVLVGWATAGQFKPLPQQRTLYGDVMAFLEGMDRKRLVDLIASLDVLAGLLNVFPKGQKERKGKVRQGK